MLVFDFVLGICITISGQFPGLLLRFDFWNAVKAYNQIFFEDAIKRIKEHVTEAHAHMMKIPLSM